jgi:hypothetical protein
MGSAFCDGILDPEFFPLVSGEPLSNWILESALGMRYHLLEKLWANNGKQEGDDGEKEGDEGEKEGDDGEKECDEGEKEGAEGEKEEDEAEANTLIGLAEDERRNHPAKFTALYKGGIMSRLRAFFGVANSVRQPESLLRITPADFSQDYGMYFAESEQLAQDYARLARRMHPSSVTAGLLKVWVETELLGAVEIEGEDWKKVQRDNLTSINGI